MLIPLFRVDLSVIVSDDFALLDDIATLLDDISLMSKVAAKKSASVLSDDLAVNAEQVAVPARLEDVLPKKFLIEKGLHLDDDVYLLQLKNEMELAASTVVECCKGYWEVMLDCHSVGERLINSVSVAEIERVLSSGEYYIGGVHLADPRQESGMSWFLAVAKYYIEHDDSFKTVTFSYLKEFPFFEDVIGNGYLYRKLTDKIWEVAGDLAVSQFTASETLGRLLILQQKLILTSTSESPWMLESSDSATEEEMIFFIKKMLKDTRNGDAFSEIVRQRFKHCSDDQNSVLEVLVECELLVVACPQSIGVISAISECADEFPVFLAGKIERESVYEPQLYGFRQLSKNSCEVLLAELGAGSWPEALQYKKRLVLHFYSCVNSLFPIGYLLLNVDELPKEFIAEVVHYLESQDLYSPSVGVWTDILSTDGYRS